VLCVFFAPFAIAKSSSASSKVAPNQRPQSLNVQLHVAASQDAFIIVERTSIAGRSARFRALAAIASAPEIPDLILPPM